MRLRNISAVITWGNPTASLLSSTTGSSTTFSGCAWASTTSSLMNLTSSTSGKGGNSGRVVSSGVKAGSKTSGVSNSAGHSTGPVSTGVVSSTGRFSLSPRSTARSVSRGLAFASLRCGIGGSMPRPPNTSNDSAVRGAISCNDCMACQRRSPPVGAGASSSLRKIRSAIESRSSDAEAPRRTRSPANLSNPSACASLSLLMSMRQPVNLAAKRAFWPSLPIARLNCRSGTTTIAVLIDELFSSSRTLLTLAGLSALVM